MCATSASYRVTRGKSSATRSATRRRGLDANEVPNAYGRELDALIEALRLDESA